MTHNSIIKSMLSRKEISQIEEKILEHTLFHKKNYSAFYCNFVLIPQGIGPIAKRQIFGDENKFMKFIYKKDGEFLDGHESDYLTKIINYDLFSKKTLEEIFIENLPIPMKKSSLPLFSESHISKFCNDYWSTTQTREVAFPLFYSEVLNEIDSNNSQVFDWDILSKKYEEKVTKLRLIQDLRDIL